MFMRSIGLICEYNPFHKGHLYQIEMVKKMYPEYAIVLVLGGYFLERGDISLISKRHKTEIALKHGVDLVIELPVLYGVNSGDFFAYYAVDALNKAGVDKIIFGSECDDVEFLKKIARMQKEEAFQDQVKKYLKEGNNYPSSLAKSLNTTLESNDILGVAYIKAIDKINSKIEPVTIKRTNTFNDVKSDGDIVSAQNIRERLKNGEDISRFIPDYDFSVINEIDYDRLLLLLRYRITTEKHLERFLGVDEGLENKLKKEILSVNSYKELVDVISSKRYTKSRIKRMLIHILLGIEKSDMEEIPNRYIILGFSKLGKNYLKELSSESLVYKINSRSKEIEKNAAMIYNILTEDDSTSWDVLNKPVQN